MAKKVLKLEIENEYDFLLLALICGYKDYRLCFELNLHLKLNLKREKDIELVLDKQKNKSLFAAYFYARDEEQYRIISNKGTTFAFIPEKKNIDSFLLIKNYKAGTSIDELITRIKKIEIISGVYEMNPEELKSGENFLIIE